MYYTLAAVILYTIIACDQLSKEQSARILKGSIIRERLNTLIQQAGAELCQAQGKLNLF